jgi:uncharacterized protein (PEP-CTERM system associated)
MNSRAGIHCASLTLALAAIAASPARGEWNSDASISLGSYFSDNICLAPRDEEGKAVGTVTPRVNVSGQGGRSKTTLNAAVEYNSIGNSSIECPERGAGINPSNRETWIPRINFLTEFTAIENLLFLEADAFAAQNPLNPFAAGGNDNINATGNSNITYRWGVGGRLERNFNDTWGVLARYNYNEQYNSFNQLLGDSQEDRFEFDAGKIPGTSRLAYGVRGQYSEVTFAESATREEFTNRLSRAELRAALQLSSDWQFNGFAGQEDNVFISELDDIDGSYWDVGVQWTPNARVNIGIGYGERFFGDAPRASITYRHKRSELRASYLRDIQFPRNIRTGGGAAPPDDLTGPVIGDPGDPLLGDDGLTFIGQSPVLSERFTLAYRFTGRRTNFSISASDSNQTRVENGAEGDFASVTVRASRQLARRFSVDAGVSWRQNEGNLFGSGVGGFIQDLEQWQGSFGVNRSLSDSTSLTLRYSYTDQESTRTNNSFQENRVSLSLNHNL